MNAVFDYFNKREIPPIILCTPNKESIASLGASYDIKNIIRYNDLDELEFTFPQSVDNGKTILEAYSKIQKRMLVLVESIGYYIIIDCPEDSDGNTAIKQVFCQSLESELIHKRITNLTGTFSFYNTNYYSGTLLEIILKACPGWELGYIDPPLYNVYRTFNISNNNVYNLLMNDVSRGFNCIFTFDSFRKIISAYHIPSLGEEVDIYISLDNIARKLTLEEYSDEQATKLYCYGGNGLDIRWVNPLGGNYIFNFDYYKTTQWMYQELIDALDAWEEKVDLSQNQYSEISTARNEYIYDLSEAESNLKIQKANIAAAITSLRVMESSLLSLDPNDPGNTDTIATLETDISNIKVEIRLHKEGIRRTYKIISDIKKELDYYNGELKKIVNNIKFIKKEFLDNFVDDVYNIILKIKRLSKDWKAIYHENSDILDLDLADLYEYDSEISLAFNSIENNLSDLLIYAKTDALNHLTYNINTINLRKSQINKIYTNIQELKDIFQLLISNTSITNDLYSIMVTLNIYTEIISYTENFTYDQYLDLQSFIFENTYTNENIIITDVMDNTEIQKWSQELYDQAIDVINRIAYPRYEFSGEFINFLSLIEFSDFIEKIDFGKMITLELPGGEIIKPVLLEIEYHYDKPENSNIIFSNRVKLNQSNFKFADLFIDSAQKGSGVSGITASSGNISGVTNTVSSDLIGGTNLLNVSNALISKLGYISFGLNPPDVYGNNVGVWLGYDAGAKLSLYSSEEDYLQWDGQKLLIKARNFTLDELGRITATSAYFSGTIEAARGHIGGWVIGDTALYSYLDGNYVGMNSDVQTGPAFYAGQTLSQLIYFPVNYQTDNYWNDTYWEASFLQSTNDAEFRVYVDGSVVATSASISGTITALAGDIGGWQIAPNYLYSGSITLHSGSPAILMGNALSFDEGVGIFLGKDNIDNFYKLRIGDPDSDMLWWDGEKLNVLGYVASTDMPFDLELMKMQFQTISWAQFAIFDDFSTETKRENPESSIFPSRVYYGWLDNGEDNTPDKEFGFTSKIYNNITSVYSGSSTDVGENYLIDTNATWFENQYLGYLLKDSSDTEFQILESSTSGSLTISGIPASGSYIIISKLPTAAVAFCSYKDSTNNSEGSGFTKLECSFDGGSNWQTFLDTENSIINVGGAIMIDFPGRDYQFKITIKNDSMGNGPIVYKTLMCTDPAVWGKIDA